MHSTPRVSIGLPVYNGARYIAETLDSLLAQTFEDFELIICDNASTDRTEEICRAYAARDKRIRYVRHAENLGAAKNYRHTFELASGAYFRWANCDDLFRPESLCRCVEVLDHEPSVVLTYPKTQLIDAQGHAISAYEDRLHLQSPKASERFAQLIKQLGLVNVIYGLMRAESLRHTALMRNFAGGDIPLVAELALYGKFWEIPEYLFYRRLHAEAYSNLQDEAQIQAFFDPKRKGQLSLRHWQHLFAHVGSMMRAPLGLVEKMRLSYCLVQMGFWNRNELAGELRGTLQHGLYKYLPGV